MRVKLDKIASVTAALPLPREVVLCETVDAREGAVVIVEALEEKAVYNQVELTSGEMVPVQRGDILAGALGERRALKGYVGGVPARVQVGDVLHLLNLGGTVGLCTEAHRDYGDPIRVKVLGAPALPFRPSGHGPNIRDLAVPWRESLPQSAPIVLISGTCMNAGKTSAACAVIQHLAAQGHRVGAAKLTGVALLRDVNKMRAYGAVGTMSFVDAGLPSTTNADAVVPAAKGVLHALNREVLPDVIVVELGDGILGGYGVERILHDADLMAHTKVHITCANDPVAAWGARQIMQDRYGLHIDVFSGPATDNGVGVEYIESALGIPAANALDGARLGRLVEEKLGTWLKLPLSAGPATLAANCCASC